MKYATIIIPFGFTPRWGQIVISSLKAFKNDRDFHVVLMNNSPERNDIDAVAKTSIGEGIEIQVPPPGQRWHAGSLEYYIPQLKTPYMFALESDCTVNRDGWLDWYAGFMKDEYVAMAGWYWQERPDFDDERHYINASATLYNSNILKLLNAECLANPDSIICYGLENEKRMFHDTTAKRIEEGYIGCFSEFRGFQQLYPVAPKPDKWWQEPGNWLYNRASCQWECVKVPGQIVRNMEPPCATYKYNFYGESDEEAYARHYWAGTVSHNFDKHLVSVPWEADCIEWWLKREYNLWKQIVPEPVRKLSLDQGYVKKLDEELKYAMSRVHIVKEGDLVRVYHKDVQDYIKGEVPEPNLLSHESADGKIVGYHHKHGKWIVKFDDKPLFPYSSQYSDGDNWYAEVDSLQCIRR